MQVTCTWTIGSSDGLHNIIGRNQKKPKLFFVNVHFHIILWHTHRPSICSVCEWKLNWYIIFDKKRMAFDVKYNGKEKSLYNFF